MRTFSLVLAVSLLSGPARAQDLECLDPVGPDCDGDGYEPPEDCDDWNPDVHPDAVEICNNGLDDDCNGVVDEDCYYRFQDARLEGGSTCESNDDGWALVALLPLLWWRRRA